MSACNSAPECPTAALSCNLPALTMDCNTGLIDLDIDADCNVTTDCQIVSQIIMALFIRGRDERARGNCKGGWWANPNIGSKLWALDGRVLTSSNQDATVTEVEQEIERSLAHLVTENIIDSVTVNASAQGDAVIVDDIIITRPTGETNYAHLWEAGCLNG